MSIQERQLTQSIYDLVSEPSIDPDTFIPSFESHAQDGQPAQLELVTELTGRFEPPATPQELEKMRRIAIDGLRHQATTASGVFDETRERMEEYSSLIRHFANLKELARLGLQTF